jgi:microcystin degradation protein MlrC
MKQLLYILSGLLLILSCSCQPEKGHKKVLTLGIRHESNTFSTLSTKKSDFKVLRGADVINGELWPDVFKQAGIELIPTLHAYAWPGGAIEQDVFESFMNEILDSIKNAGPLDGVYMDMHGALHAEGYEDAQVTLIKKIRELVGKDVLICGSFDLHGNPSPDFVENIDLLTAYRTAPHRDVAETKVRAAQLLTDALANKWDPSIEYVVVPILVPGEKSITEVEPLHTVYAQLPEVSKKEGFVDASVFVGYCWADLPRAAMRVFVTAKDAGHSASAKKEAQRIARQIWDKRKDMKLDVPSGSIEEMLTLVKEYPDKTVFISDSGDNTTAGAPGDNTQVLKALLKHNAKNALVAGIVDPNALEKCINAGIGAEVNLKLGGKVDYIFGSPLEIKGKVVFLSHDSIINTNRGAAIIETNGVKTVIINARRSFVKVNDFSEVGLDPLAFKTVVVKLGYLYPELRDIAPVHLMALTSGFCNLDVRTLPYKKVHRPSYPLDIEMEFQP